MKINCRLSEFAAVLPQVSLVIYGRQTRAKSLRESAAGSCECFAASASRLQGIVKDDFVFQMNSLLLAANLCL